MTPAEVSQSNNELPLAPPAVSTQKTVAGRVGLLFPGGDDGTDGGVVCLSLAAASIQLTCLRQAARRHWQLCAELQCLHKCTEHRSGVVYAPQPSFLLVKHLASDFLFLFFFFFFFKDSVCGLLHGSDYSLQQRCARRIQLFIGETTAIYLTPRCVCLCQTSFPPHQS